MAQRAVHRKEIDEMVGRNSGWATRRFPLEQRDKTRLIDDALASGLNSALLAPATSLLFLMWILWYQWWCRWQKHSSDLKVFSTSMGERYP